MGALPPRTLLKPPARPRNRPGACPCDLKPGDITIGRAYGKPFGAYVACPTCGERDVIMLRAEMGGEPQAFEEAEEGRIMRLEPGWLCRSPWCQKRTRVVRGNFVIT